MQTELEFRADVPIPCDLCGRTFTKNFDDGTDAFDLTCETCKAESESGLKKIGFADCVVCNDSFDIDASDLLDDDTEFICDRCETEKRRVVKTFEKMECVVCLSTVTPVDENFIDDFTDDPDGVLVCGKCLDEVDAGRIRQKQFQGRVSCAITRQAWRAVYRHVRKAINTGLIDVWYDAQPVIEAVTADGYHCYTCWLKSKGVLPKSHVCYADYEEMGAEMRERNCGKNPTAEKPQNTA